MTRVAIFVDGSNFYHGLKTAFGRASIDFGELARRLSAGRELVRLYYYNAPRREADDPEKFRAQQRFFEALQRTDYVEVRLGRLEPREFRCPECGHTVRTYVEKGVDARLAVDMLRLAYENVYGCAILVSADGDFAPAVEEVKNRGKHVENAWMRGGASYHLRRVCDRFLPIDDELLQNCWLPSQ